MLKIELYETFIHIVMYLIAVPVPVPFLSSLIYTDLHNIKVNRKLKAENAIALLYINLYTRVTAFEKLLHIMLNQQNVCGNISKRNSLH